MKKLIEVIKTDKRLQGLMLFLPFTGIIKPEWYVLLLVTYFIVGGYYFFMYKEDDKENGAAGSCA